MKGFAFLAFGAFALAAPLQKREVVYETIIEEVVETTYTTTTIWVDPTDVPSSSREIGGFYELPKSAPASPSKAPASSSPAPAPSPAYVAPVQAAAPVVSPPPAPVVEPYVAPPAPTTTTAPAPAPAPQQAYTPPAPAATTSAAAPAAAPASDYGSSSGGSGDHTGDLTYYDVSVGTGSCGTLASNDELVVALAKADMNNGINPNANPLCGKMINIYYNGQTHKAKVHDTCPVCKSGSIDVPEPLFKAIAPNGDGRVSGVSWSFA